MKRLLIAAILAVVSGCQQPETLQPFVAVTGAYALMDRAPPPAPEPPADGCVKGCKCGGTGVEKTGDGLSKTPCRCPDDCGCKKKARDFTTKSAPVCTTGTCGWPPRNISR